MNEHFDKPLFRFSVGLFPTPEYIRSVANDFRKMALAYTAWQALTPVAGRGVIRERDFDTNVPKALRDEAIARLVELGYLNQIDWQGKTAWTRGNKEVTA